MKVKDIIKKQTTIIAIAVVLVATTVIGVSYAIFFNVGKNADNQVITAGTLKMTISGVSALDLSEPVGTDVGLASSPVSYTIKNTASDLPATYQIYIYTGTDNQIDASKIKVSEDGTTYKQLTEYPLEQVDGTNRYRISESAENIGAGATATTKNIRLWLDEDLMVEEDAGKKVDLNLYIVSEVNES